MALSCSCPEPDEGSFFCPATDFSALPGKHRKRCKSCGILIDIGASCVAFVMARAPRTQIEEKIYIDEVPLATRYVCEQCGEIWFNLSDIGYCLLLGGDWREDLREYQEITGFRPAKTRKENHEP